MRFLPKIFIFFCLSFLLWQLVVFARWASVTTDEGVHLISGWTYLKQRNWRFDPEHPPLLKELAAVPLLLIDIQENNRAKELWQNAGSNGLYYDSWRDARQYSQEILYRSNNNPERLIFLGRLAAIGLTMILAFIIVWLTWREFGPWPAAISAGLFSANPLFLGHGSLVNTDIIAALAFLLAVWWWTIFLRRTTIVSAILCGLSLGFLLLAKHTSIIFLPLAIVLYLYFYFKNKRPLILNSKFLILALVTFIILWAGYLFSVNGLANFVKGLLMVIGHSAGGHNSFLLGQSSREGWWYYFPVAFFLKTPWSFLLLVILAIFFVPPKYRWWLIAPMVYLIIAMMSKANLGIRHLAPLYPFLIIFISGLVVQSKRWLRTITIVLLAANFLSVWLQRPDYLSYFNEIVRAEDGYHYLLDSNYDWGQDLKAVRKFIDDNYPDQTIYIAYGWGGDEALDYYFGNHWQKLTPDSRPEKGILVISASNWQILNYDWLKQEITRRNLTLFRPVRGVFVFYLP